MPCNQIIHELACIEAGVTLTPSVTLGTITVSCVGVPMAGECPNDTEAPTCTFDVHQEVCVRIPISFNATAAVTEQEITCDGFGTGECQTSFECCEFIMATQGTTANGDPLQSLSIQLCGPANQCSPQGNHINVVFPANGPRFQINLAEMLTMECNSPGPGLITVTAQANFNNGAGNTQLANFTFIFDSANHTVHIIATSVANGTTLLDTTITLTGNVQFVPCTPTVG